MYTTRYIPVQDLLLALVDGYQLNLGDQSAVLKIQGRKRNLHALFRADGGDCLFGPENTISPASITFQN